MITRRALMMGTGIIASATVLDARFGRGERTRGGGHLPVPQLIVPNPNIGRFVKEDGEVIEGPKDTLRLEMPPP